MIPGLMVSETDNVVGETRSQRQGEGGSEMMSSGMAQYGSVGAGEIVRDEDVR